MQSERESERLPGHKEDLLDLIVGFPLHESNNVTGFGLLFDYF